MIPNHDEDLVVLIATADRRVERHRIRAWDTEDGGPLVLDSFGGLVAGKLLGTVRGVEGNDR